MAKISEYVGDQSESESPSDKDLMMPSKYIKEGDNDANDDQQFMHQTDFGEKSDTKKNDDFTEDQTKAFVLSSSKSKSTNKIFSDEAEITLLQGVDDYLTQNSIEYEKIILGEFYVFISPKLTKLTTVKYTKKQICEKLRSLKTKYIKGKGRNGNVHDCYLFELSKKIWEDKKITNNIPSKKRGNEITEEDLKNDYPFLYGSFEDGKEDRVKEKSHLIGRKEARRLELKFSELSKLHCGINARDADVQIMGCELHILLDRLRD